VNPHDWFEGRARTLIVFIDDATGRLTRLQFAPAETTKAYLQALGEAHVLAHGLPLAFYSDRHGIFRANAKEAEAATAASPSSAARRTAAHRTHLHRAFR
jgi:hypothetical protein